MISEVAARVEYRVLAFGIAADARHIETRLNEMAKDGWRLVCIHHDHFIFERVD